ncbi:MAG TPA: hypothetical protein EYQ29_07885 [Candidatus Lambdaproteobacteria bacterium]|nr:hypothetical protein [Candidatus Lambdaproteobacteria bacterium]
MGLGKIEELSVFFVVGGEKIVKLPKAGIRTATGQQGCECRLGMFRKTRNCGESFKQSGEGVGTGFRKGKRGGCQPLPPMFFRRKWE